MEESRKYQDLLSTLKNTLDFTGDSRRIICNRGVGFETTVEKKNGLLLGKAWSYQFLLERSIDELFSLNVPGAARLHYPYLLVMKRLHIDIGEVVPLLENIVRSNSSLLIVTEDICDELLATFVVNYVKGILKIFVVRSNFDNIVDNFYKLSTLKSVQLFPKSSDDLLNIEEVHTRKHTTVAILPAQLAVDSCQDICVVKIGGEDYEDQSARLKFALEWINEQDVYAKLENSEPQSVKSDRLQENLSQLQSLIGLTAVKQSVQEIASIARVSLLQAKAGVKFPKITRHLVFTGDPGTGKTTVARLLGEIYKELSILSMGHFVEVGRVDLIAEYLGQTARKTESVVQSALGGVLFIDEAYSLVPDGQTDMYGQEAISTLLKMMEDYRDDLVVIVAGYREDMQRFIGSNPGLKSRFSKSIHFENYSANELTDIFKVNCDQHDYLIPGETLENIANLFRLFDGRIGELGNGRFVRNVFDRCIAKQCVRLSMLSTLEQLSVDTLKTFCPMIFLLKMSCKKL